MIPRAECDSSTYKVAQLLGYPLSRQVWTGGEAAAGTELRANCCNADLADLVQHAEAEVRATPGCTESLAAQTHKVIK